MRNPLLVIFLCFFCDHSFASAPSMSFTEISLRDGLSQSTVLDITQDQQGFMWFATQDGLNRFDGYDFVVYRHDEDKPNSLSENYVNSVFQDSNGYLWLTTRNGLNRFDPKKNSFTQFYHDRGDQNSLGSNWTFAANEDHLGHIWVGTIGAGLSVFNPNTDQFLRYTHDPNDDTSLSDNDIYDIFIDRTGVMWIATRNGGVSRFNNEKNNFTQFVHDPADPGSISHNTVYKIYQHSDGTLWFATRGGGLNRFDQKSQTFKAYRYDPNDQQSISSDQVWSIVEDDKGDLLVGTFADGLNRWVKESDQFVRVRHNSSTKNGLASNAILASYADSMGLLWFGVGDVGLNLFNPRTALFKHYRNRPSDPNSLSHNSVQYFLQLQNSRIIVGTGNGDLRYFDPQNHQFTPIIADKNPASGLLNTPMNQFIQDRNGDLWIATKADGLSRYNFSTEKVRQYRADPNDQQSIGSDEVIALIQDRLSDKLWVGTREGLSLFDPQTGKAVNYRNDPADLHSLSNNWVTYLLIDHDGQLWVGTQGGLSLFSNKTSKFSNYRHDPVDTRSLSSDSILSLFEDSHNNFWVSTSSGLNKLISGSDYFARFQVKQGLSNDQVYGVLEDREGYLWVITNYGINRFNLDDNSFTLYTELDGLQNNEFNQGAFYRLADGQLMVGGVNGFNLFDPHKITSNPFPPQVRITNFRIYNQSVPVGEFIHQQLPRVFLNNSITYTDSISLTDQESVFSFEFAALHYSAPDLNHFAYRLLGFDDSWTYTDFKNRRATYTNLPAGNYIFEIKAANKDRLWSTEVVKLAVEIMPPWWLTKVAKFIWLVLLFITINLLYRFKTNQIRKQKTQLQLQVSRQVAQVVQQKRALETSYRDIKLLSKIGQKINSSLDLEKVLWAVYEDINKLMDGTVFCIGIYEPEKNRVKLKLVIEKGQRNQPYFRSMLDKKQFSVWCIDNDEVVFVNDLELDGRRYLQEHEFDDPDNNSAVRADGAYSGIPQSFIYVPMRSGDSVLGFLSVQSFSKHVYQDVHIDILRTLATYTGTAIANAKEHQELIDSRRELIESEKMASLGALTAGVAHEINNPANFVHVSAQNLEIDLANFQTFVVELAGEEADPEILKSFNRRFEPLYKHVGTIKDGTSRIKAIVQDLRAFTHLDAADKKSVSVTDNILSTIHLAQTQFSDVAEFITDFNDDPQLVCYPSQLNQVYLNLIVNACDAIRDKQRQQKVNSKGRIVIGCRSLIDQVEITIKDNGNGMSEATKKRLFEPFYTTKDVGEGSGLGLSISYGIVKKHEGKLTAQTQAGVGTTFKLLLPYRTKGALAKIIDKTS